MTLSEHARRARRVRIAVSAAFMAGGVVIGGWAPHIPLVKERLGLGPGLLGAALLAMAVGAVVAMPTTGRLIARFGSGPVTRTASLIFVPAFLLPILAPNLPFLIAALAVFGAATGIMDVAMNAHAVHLEERMGKPIMSSFHGLFSLGGLVGAAVGGVMLSYLDPLIHAVSMCVVVFVGLFLALRHLFPGTADAGGHRERMALPNLATLGFGVLAFLSLMSEGAVLDWSAVYLRESLGAEAGVAAAGFAAFSATMAVGRLLGDAVRARIGAAALVRGSGFVAAAGLGTGLFVATPTAAVVGFACTGIGLANLVPILFGAAGRASGRAAGGAIATVATLGYSGFLVGPPLIGFVAEVESLAGALWLLVGACAVLGLAAPVTRVADGDGAE